MPTKTTIPKPIQILIQREAELQAAADRWSVDAFRAERDRLETIIHSGSATDADIEAHAATRDGGKVDKDYQAMSASSQAALDAHRRASWPQFRRFLCERLEARREREESIVNDVAALREKHGIQIDYFDPEASTTSQLSFICMGEDVGFIRFGVAAETF
jgi:hypothetical protein